MTGGGTNNVAAQIARVLDTTGFISSDHHVHGIASADSRVSSSDRVRQFAGEGVDNIIMTDHHHHTDLNPRIAALGFTAFVTSTIGEEITTWDTGHYNAYPMLIDPTRPSGGSTDWGGAAPAGEDFPSHGNYILTPGGDRRRWRTTERRPRLPTPSSRSTTSTRTSCRCTSTPRWCRPSRS